MITQLEFKDNDFKNSESIAKQLGFKQTAYTSTSELIGLFCIIDGEQYKRGKKSGCIIKSKELGFLFVQHLEDLGIDEGGLK